MAKMINLEKKIGGFRLRTWGLLLNFIGNAFALYGIVGVMQSQKDWGFLISGVVITIVCILVLAIPSRD